MDQRLPEPAVTDWRGLCEELTEHLALLDEPPHELVCRAQAALAQPEPEVAGPTDQELADAFAEGCRDGSKAGEPPFLGGARAVLARWGRPAPVPVEGEVAELARLLRLDAHFERGDGMPQAAARFDRAADLLERQAAPVPVPVSERPWEREGWCDDEDRCWCMSSLDGPPPRWWLVRPEPLSDGWVLPAHALPLPSGEVES